MRVAVEITIAEMDQLEDFQRKKEGLPAHPQYAIRILRDEGDDLARTSLSCILVLPPSRPSSHILSPENLVKYLHRELASKSHADPSRMVEVLQLREGLAGCGEEGEDGVDVGEGVRRPGYWGRGGYRRSGEAFENSLDPVGS